MNTRRQLEVALGIALAKSSGKVHLYDVSTLLAIVPVLPFQSYLKVCLNELLLRSMLIVAVCPSSVAVTLPVLALAIIGRGKSKATIELQIGRASCRERA